MVKCIFKSAIVKFLFNKILGDRCEDKHMIVSFHAFSSLAQWHKDTTEQNVKIGIDLNYQINTNKK